MRSEKNINDLSDQEKEIILEQMENLFQDSTEYGTLDNISTLGCLALVRLSLSQAKKYGGGYIIWNFWRATFPVICNKKTNEIKNRANFYNVDFTTSENEQIDFSFFKFGDYAVFAQAIFGNEINFFGSMFGVVANFNGAIFNDLSSFICSEFGNDANFIGIQSAGRMRFEFSKFGDNANFHAAQFSDWCFFDNAMFHGSVTFAGEDWGYLRRLYLTDNLDLTQYSFKSRKEWADGANISPKVFHNVSFRGARFGGVVNLSNREFRGVSDFSKALFEYAPNFHGSTIYQNTYFDGCLFPSPKGLGSQAREYRVLKLAFSKFQSTREEQRFFRLEMAEEAKIARDKKYQDSDFKFFPALYYWLYKNLSDYGFSTMKPFLWLICLPLFLTTILSIYFCYLNDWRVMLSPQTNWEITREAVVFTFENSLPIISSGKLDYEKLLEIYGEFGFFFLSICGLLQKFLAVIAFFLIGLALRNQFKIK